MVRLLSAGMLIWLPGALMNLAALVANQGLFPEHAPGSYPGYINAEEANLAWLGDWIQVGHYWFSPGDTLIFVGLAVVLGAWSGLVWHGFSTGDWWKRVSMNL